MNLLDASALIAFLRDEPGRREVEKLIRDRSSGVPTIVVAEAIDVLVRRLGIDAQRATAALTELVSDAIRVLPLDLAAATRAGEVRARRYHRSNAPLSMADCIVIASASAGDSIASTDARLLEVAALEGVGAVELER